MAFEKFNQNDMVPGYDRPEDTLETPDVIAVKKRERIFNEEGGFKDLLKLKIVVEDLVSTPGLLYGTAVTGYIKDLISDPAKYAYSSLGFDHLEYTTAEEIPADYLKVALENYLKNCQIELANKIDKYLEIITIYETATHSDALGALKEMLENCKGYAQQGDWEEYTKKELTIKSYVRGMGDLVEMCCGSAREDDSTKKVLGVK